MNNDSFAERNRAVPGPVFVQPWWLDAVAPGAWDAVNIEQNGQLVARLPYVIVKRYGLTFLTMAPLTQVLGPWIRPYQGKPANHLAYEHRLMAELIGQLPPFSYFRQNFDHSVSNWLPFYWEGFQQTTRYTYVIDDLSDLDRLWKSAKKTVRRDVRKAKRELKIRDDLGLETFLDLNEMTFSRQGKALPYSRDLVRRLDRACELQKCRRIFFAEDARGAVHAAAYVVWDENRAYYLMGGADPRLRQSSGSTLVLWEAIGFAATVSRTFDFEGSMHRSIERFFRAFATRQKPYFRVTRANSLPLKMIEDVRSWVAHMGL